MLQAAATIDLVDPFTAAPDPSDIHSISKSLMRVCPEKHGFTCEPNVSACRSAAIVQGSQQAQYDLKTFTCMNCHFHR